jgi:thiol:disulfide interchange protein
MVNRICLVIVILTGIVSGVNGNAFSSLSFTDALDAGIEENKPVIVKFEADWCSSVS